MTFDGERRIIAVVSGKGGTGKTTLASSLALVAGVSQLVDCDVEEPNAHIFMRPTFQQREPVVGQVAVIDEERCDYCGLCARFCSFGALAILDQVAMTFPELCRGCGGCELICPRGAIQWLQRSLGTVEAGRANGVAFVQGTLNVGEARAVPVIDALRPHLGRTGTILLDAPPGTSCPVVAVMRMADVCLLVTEPTPFGLHDLMLAVEIARKLGLPPGVVINRTGGGFRGVTEYCQRERLPVLLEIPYDRRIAVLGAAGTPFVVEMPEWRRPLQNLLARTRGLR